MPKLRSTALVLLTLTLACKDDGADDAGLFGTGGDESPFTADDDGSTSVAGTGTDDGEDSPPPPPPPPPPPGDGTTTDPGTDDGTTTGDTTAPGTDDGTTTGDDTGTDTFNDGTLEVMIVNQSMFPQGQCDDVYVTNVSGMAVAWEVTLAMPGIMNQNWNCTVLSEMGGMATFAGIGFNAMLDPGAQAMFGYCVDY